MSPICLHSERVLVSPTHSMCKAKKDISYQIADTNPTSAQIIFLRIFHESEAQMCYIHPQKHQLFHLDDTYFSYNDKNVYITADIKTYYPLWKNHLENFGENSRFWSPPSSLYPFYWAQNSNDIIGVWFKLLNVQFSFNGELAFLVISQKKMNITVSTHEASQIYFYSSEMN